VRYVILRDGQEIPVEILEAGPRYRITLGDRSFEVDSMRIVGDLYSLTVEGKSYEATVHRATSEEYRVHLYDGMRSVTLLSPLDLALRGREETGGGAAGTLRAPMPGRVVKVLVSEGQAVKKGEGVVVVEAMKMQNELSAPHDGVVKSVRAREGDSVERGAELVTIE